MSVSQSINRPAQVVWSAVADPSHFASWSPESAGSRSKVAGALPVGAEFTGRNRHGVFRWSTQCRVTESTPGEVFAFEVTYMGMTDATWRYSLTPTEGGCLVEEQCWDNRGRLLELMGTIGTGVADRVSHNRVTMTATLQALKQELESEPGSAGPRD